MAKKKASAENGTPNHAGPSTEVTSATPLNEDIKGPTVFFQLADGSGKTKRKLKQNATFDSILSKTINKLAPEVNIQQIRLSHVRDQGREVDLIDEYDYASFQRRAFDNPSTPQTIKVYIPGSSFHPTPGPSAPLSDRPQSPSPAGLANSNVSIFETPKGKSKKDRKGKQKAQDDTPQQAEAHGTSQLAETTPLAASSPAPSTPAGDQVPVPKSSKKRKHQDTERRKSRVSSSSFDAPSADHPPILTKDSISTSPTNASMSSPNKSRKRKRLSELPTDFQIPLPPASPTPSPSPSANTSETRQRRSKSPEKKKRRKAKKNQEEGTEQRSVVHPSPAVQIHLSSASPAVSPYQKLNKYKPATPSPLGRMPTPSVDGDADEDSIQGESPKSPKVIEEPPKSPTKEKKKRGKKDKKKSEEVAQNEELPTVESQAEGEDEAEMQVDEPSVIEFPKKQSSKEKEKDSVEEIGSPTEIIQPESLVETPVQADTPTPSKKEKKKSRKKQEVNVAAAQPDAEVVPASESAAMDVDQGGQSAAEIELDASSSRKAAPPLESGPRRITNIIPLSSPYILYVRPNDPLPFVTARYNSSTFERKAQKTYGKSARSVTPPEDVVMDDDAILLEEEELPKSPEPPSKVEVAQKKKRKSGVSDEQAEKQKEGVINAPSPTTSSTMAQSPLSTTSSNDLSKSRRHLSSEYHLKLAARGHCIICDGDAHLQKDCPAVAQGPDRLRELLEKKRQEQDDPLAEASIEAIEMWIDRLAKITRSVKGTSSPADPSKKGEQRVVSSPTSIQNSATTQSEKPTALRDEEDAPIKTVELVNKATSRISVSPEPEPVIEAVSSPTSPPPAEADPTSTSQQEPAPEPTVASEIESISEPESSPAPEPSPSPSPAPPPILSQQSQPAQSPSRDHSAPPIYLKALATKAGSVSGLSVSDAVIETGSSASESDSDEESGSDSDAESSSSKGSRATSSRSQSRSRSPSPLVGQRTGSLGTPSLTDFMSMPLSQKLKQRARQSAAGMMEVEMDEEIQEASDNESSPERQLPLSSFAGRARGGSESSVGEFADEKSDEEPDMEEDEVMPFTQSVAAEPNQEEQGETIESALGEARKSPSPPSTHQSKRSFTDLADVSSPTPIVAEFPGSIALQEAIDEDDAPERMMDGDASVRNEDCKTGHIISQGLMSPPSSSGEDLQEEPSEPMPATQLVDGDAQDEEATPRPLRRRVTRAKATEESELAAPIDIRLSSSQPVPSASSSRQLRSMSRELSAEPSSPRMTTRRVSASQPVLSSRLRSVSPSNAPARRSSRRTTPSSQIDELASSPQVPLRRSSRRGSTPLRSSQAEQLESSPPNVMKTPAPIPEEDESAAEDNEQPQQTPEALKTPLVPETQESVPRRGSRSRPSPLFMSQGSQIPQTQAYNLYPNLPSSDTGASVDETPKGRTNGVAESPLSSRKANGLGRKASLRFTSPIIEEDTTRGDQVKDSQPQEESEHEVNGNGKPASSEGSASASESEDELPPVQLPRLRSSRSTPSLYPGLPKPKQLSSFQPNTHTAIPSAFPALSALSKDFITRRASFGVGGPQKSNQPRMSLPASGFSKSQPQPTTKSDDESESGSGSDSDSSEEEKTPAGLKGRFAKGGRERKKRFSASQPNIGW
ncbi:hypothetical protein I302_104418 [Kwoniella bestiolae CBS 10118]|uniref:Uncharacterized protein n=1 Tax=Kwoniella bestiolae CBS 10118 TaxID=1296100 RepID=A0A1B9GB73_9TREE|nr:hypothetical protein I302_03123 [Kwoniella bestiolae CBS 10118]OCF28270.1 hypothetical protein I302_03123 [Kwoniella bestiolae CBS 10118]